VCPGCERGCSIQVWHRKPEWALKSLDARLNRRIDRVTPLENPAVNGPWICNKARDLAKILERPRAEHPVVRGAVVSPAEAIASAAALIAQATRAVALVSNWGSNEELAAYHATLAPSFANWVKRDWQPQPGERVEDDVLIKADKNPNTFAARAMFPMLPDEVSDAIAPDTDLVLVWGEGAPLEAIPASARVILLTSYDLPGNARADVLIPISVQTERDGHYTNFAGTVTGFQQCVAPPPTVSHAQALFEEVFAALSPLAGARS
jgi:NADH-quinone oxidoreductase subunit G